MKYGEISTRKGSGTGSQIRGRNGAELPIGAGVAIGRGVAAGVGVGTAGDGWKGDSTGVLSGIPDAIASVSLPSKETPIWSRIKAVASRYSAADNDPGVVIGMLARTYCNRRSAVG